MKSWEPYYSMDKGRAEFGLYQVGTVFGALIDVERGTINFYKDGNDLGLAFSGSFLTGDYFFPFIQVQEECKLSIFHPYVYP